MKTVWVIRLLVVLTGFVAFATPRGYAQSEVDPDHFGAPNTEPIPRSKTKAGVATEMGKVRFAGKVTLPYTVQCAGKRLPPGTYSLSLHSDGKTGRAMLNQKSQTIEVAGVVRIPADSRVMWRNWIWSSIRIGGWIPHRMVNRKGSNGCLSRKRTRGSNDDGRSLIVESQGF